MNIDPKSRCPPPAIQTSNSKCANCCAELFAGPAAANFKDVQGRQPRATGILENSNTPNSGKSEKNINSSTKSIPLSAVFNLHF